MTRDEKLSLVISHFPTLATDPAARSATPASGFTPGVPRLGIPVLGITDASLGVANAMDMRPGDCATALPSSLALGASFSSELAHAAGAMIASEARAKTFNVLLGGGINLTRDPWAGRNFEYIGEDPLLSGVLGGASVRGVQSRNVACTVKHFVLNSQETGRMVMDALIDDAALRESDLLAFEIAIEQGGPASVMSAYNKVNGHYASEHAALINTVLKGDWGYPGWVMSDWGAVHSTEQAALAGLDQESGIELDERLNGSVFFTDRLRAALDAGRVPAARLDDMVARILTGIMAAGAFDDPVSDEPLAIDYDANAAVAQRVAETGSVLLRNEGNLLPLAANCARIAVIGGDADVGVMSGGGSSQVRSVGGAPIEERLSEGPSAWFCRKTYHASAPLHALRDLAPATQVVFADGKDAAQAAALAASADVAVVFATQWRTEASDLETLALDGDQDALIAAIAAANPRTVVVLESGGAVLMPWLESVAAVLAVWYPGQRGGEAIARLLFGHAEPGGRLPLTFPARDGQAPRPVPPGLPELREQTGADAASTGGANMPPFSVDYAEGANVGYRWFESVGEKPLFPFGFGLSYTKFDYGELQVERGPRPVVSLTITNVGEREGTDVPQVYVRALDGRGALTWRLAGFERLTLAAGETRKVRIALEPRAYARWNEQKRAWDMPSDELPMAVGRSSAEHVVMTTLAVR